MQRSKAGARKSTPIRQPDPLVDQLQLALTTIEQGRYEEVVRAFSAVVGLAPHDRSIAALLVEALRRHAMDVTPALEDISRNHPESTAILLRLAAEAESTGGMDGARPWLERLFAFRGDDPGARANQAAAYLASGSAHLEAGRTQEAHADFARVRRLVPRRVEGYLGAARAFAQKQKHSDAVKYYQKALTLSPNDAQVAYELGRIYEVLSKPQEALPYFDRVVRLLPKNLTAWATRGEAYFRLGKFQEALHDFRQITRLDPSAAAVYRRCGEVYMAMGQPKRALLLFQQAVQRDPAETLAQEGIGQAYERLKRFPQALEQYTGMIESKATQLAGYELRAELRFARKDYEGAMADFAQVAALAPESAYGFGRCGAVHAEMGQDQEALAMYTRALEREPNNASLHQQIALTLDRLGQPAKSLPHCDLVVELAPGDAAGWAVRAEIEVELDKLPEALRDFRQVCKLNPAFGLGWRRSGDVALDLGRLAQAMTAYRRALERDPNDIDAHAGIGTVLERRKEFDEALRYYSGLVRRPATRGAAYRWRGELRFARRQYRDAVADFLQSARLQPKSSFGYRRAGDTYAEIGRNAEAIEMYQMALARDPEDYRSRAGMGLSLLGSERDDDALAAFDRTIEIAPEYAYSYYFRATIRYRRQQYEAAMEDYLAVTKLLPASNLGYRGCGDVYAELGKRREAESMFAKAIECDPKDADAHYGLALIYRDDERHQESLVHFKSAADLLPHEVNPRLGCGYANTLLNRYEPALGDFERAGKLDPGDDRPYLGRALIYEQMKDYRAAIDEYTRVLPIATNKVDVYISRGLVHADLNDYGHARQDLDTAIDLDPNNTEARRRRGEVAESAGDYTNALADYDTLIGRQPENADWHKRRADLLISMAAYDYAIESLDRAHELLGGNGAGEVETRQTKADALRLWGAAIEDGSHLVAARALIDEVLRTNDEGLSYAIRAATSAAQGAFDEAIADFDRALAKNPRDAFSLSEKVKAVYRGRNLPDALETLPGLAEQGKTDDLIKVGIALIQKKAGVKGALDELRHRAESNEDDLVNLAIACTELGEFEQAVELFRVAAERFPDSASAHNGIAWYQGIQLGRNLDDSIRHAEISTKCPSDDRSRGNNLDTLGWLLYKRGEPSKAQELLCEAVRLSPYDVVIRHHQATVAKSASQTAQI